MVNKQGKRRKDKTAKADKRTTALQRKTDFKKSSKKSAVRESLTREERSNADSISTKEQKSTGMASSVIMDVIYSVMTSTLPVVLIVVLILLSPIYLFSWWFFGLFLDDFNSIFNLTVALFGILGSAVGWFWKKSRIAVFVGGIIGVALPFGYVFLLANFISY